MSAISAYLKTGAGAAQQNRQRLADVGAAVSHIALPTIIGGDFNTQLHVGDRGRRLQELCSACDSRVLSDSGSAEEWTFKSSPGVKCWIDFILVFSTLWR